MATDMTTYLARSIAQLAVVPVRLYRNDVLEQLFFSVDLPRDPVEPHLAELLRCQDPVGYLFAEEDTFYGTISLPPKDTDRQIGRTAMQNTHLEAAAHADNNDTLASACTIDSATARTANVMRTLVLGPVRESPFSENALRRMAARLCVAPADVDDFIRAMSSITTLRLQSVLQMLCITAFVFTGKKIESARLIIHDDVQDALSTERARESFDHHEFERGGGMHSTIQIEQRLNDCIRLGKPDELRRFFAALPSFRAGVLSADRLRSEKNTFIAATTLASRAAIEGGMGVDEALSLSDSYINRCELQRSAESIHELCYHMMLEYARRMAALRVGDNPSELVLRVTNYVHNHLFEPIKTEQIAQALYVSRSFLSTRFKRETGRSLAEYIQEEKVEEAKTLLRHTAQPLVSISAHLGFCSQSHFNAIFKKRVGMTPREYRGRG